MNYWQNLLNTGNTHFNSGNWQQAEHYYAKAIERLDSQLHENPTCVESIQGWICSYHNLSTLFEQVGELEKAQKCLLVPHHSMIYMAQERSDRPDQQIIAMHALKLTLHPLIKFAQKYPTCQSCYDKLMAQYHEVFSGGERLH